MALRALLLGELRSRRGGGGGAAAGAGGDACPESWATA